MTEHGYERSEATILVDRREGKRPLCQGVQWPQESYIKLLTRGTRPKEMDEKRLRKRKLDVLAKVEMFEKGLQESEGTLQAPSQRGQKSKQSRWNMTLRGLERVICTRLDGFGRVFRGVGDGVDGGRLVVERKVEC